MRGRDGRKAERGFWVKTCSGNCPVAGHQYYLIGRLGYGATSNVWHALLDWTGNEVVIKMYVKTTDEKGGELDSQTSDEEAKRATEKEVETFKLFYPFLEGKVKHAKLSGFHCVVMPFFSPVPKEKRNASLEAVEGVLMNVFCKNNLKYDDEDVRWSHVGTFTEASNTGAGTTHHIHLVWSRRFGTSRRKQQIMGKGPPRNLGKANGAGARTKA